MRVLITGATGYVGGWVARRLLDASHEVAALVRNEAAAARLPDGADQVLGDLRDFSDVASAVAGADAVVHTAFPGHGLAWPDAVVVEHQFLKQLVDTCRGTDKTVIVSNGTIFLGDSRAGRLSESAEIVAGHPAAQRARATAQVLEEPSIRGVELRLASFVYGHGGSVFLPRLLNAAQGSGRAIYVGDGSGRASTLHVEAAAEAYLAALEKPRARGIYHVAADEEPAIREIARAVASAVGGSCRPVSVTEIEAAEALDPFTAMFLGADNRLQNKRCREHLDWSHQGYPTLLWDVAFGSYAQGARPDA